MSSNPVRRSEGASLSLAKAAALAEDAARPHNPFGEYRPMDTAGLIVQQPVGGLGLKLIRSLATDAAYSREGERNCIRITFAIRPRS